MTCQFVGAHGLPLMGSGDWNDGMNLVRAHGQGEASGSRGS
jgi:cellobiose phosphorylase